MLQKLIPCIDLTANQFVKAFISPKKIVKIGLYWLAHGLPFLKMNALYGVRAFTIIKDTYIVCDVLSRVNKSF